MRLPLSWLKEFVELDATPAEIADKLTFSGTEVEAIVEVGSTYDKVVVGEILEVAPHPGADRLTLCKVSTGSETVHVVCGAPNVVAGAKVPLAMVGAVLPGGMKIKKSKIRGETSYGMLCAEDELGLSEDHDGIMILPETCAPGTPLVDVVGPPDTVLHLEVTWNRPDCLSVLGIARELSVLFDVPLRLPEISFTETEEAVESRIRVSIEDTEGCPRYTARVLDGVALGSSPMWMQRRLAMCGVRPIMNVVDVTNYVMLECGHPLHAFDYGLLAGQEIVVRRVKSGEMLTTLDGVDRKLDPSMLVIADHDRPVALAGIMGGAGSEITSETTRVLLESATFDPAMIHHTSVQVGLSSESSHRFERSVDVETVEWASRRAAALMVAHAGASVARGVVDCYPTAYEPRSITCRHARLCALLGVDVAPERVRSILDSLGLTVKDADAAGITVTVPGYRPDLVEEADLIEEIARLHGLDEVPVTAPRCTIVPDANDRQPREAMACRNRLIGLGLIETMHYSFLSPELLDLFSGDAAEERLAGVGGEVLTATSRVVLPNPVSEDHSVLRNSLLPQIAETLGRNLARHVTEMACFEIGRIFLRTGDGETREEERIGLGLMGPVGRDAMDRRRDLQPDEVFLWLKGMIASLCRAQGIAADGKDALRFVPMEHAAFADGTAAKILVGDASLGMLGLLAERIGETWRMVDPVGLAELRLKPLLEASNQQAEITPIPAYPAVARDLALIADQSVCHDDILRIIRGAGIAELTDVQLFDIFTGKGIGEGKKSLAYSLVYRSLERTLTDEEANAFHDAVKTALRNGLEVEIRES